MWGMNFFVFLRTSSIKYRRTMNRIFRAFLLLSVVFCGTASAQENLGGPYYSPDKKVTLCLLQQKGRTFYQVYYRNNMLLDNSPVGLEASCGLFQKDMKLAGKIKNTVKSEAYIQTIGKKSSINLNYREVILPMKNLQSARIDLIFRISNDGVAYRYKLYGSGSCTVTREFGAYKFPEHTTAFMTPLSVPHSGWKRTNPSYEEHYLLDIPVGTPSPLGYGWTYPALFRNPDAGWVLISETGVSGSYCGTHLAHLSKDSLYLIEFPHIEEGLPSQHNKAMVSLPYETPWRMMIVGDAPTSVAQSTMATDLVKPLFPAKDIYKPGKASWSWVVLKDDSVTYDVTRQFIDMAAKMSFKYCLVDAPWDVQIGRENIVALSAYAQSKGVGLLLWYNSNGKWNDAPQTPKNCMDNKDVRRAEMKWMQSVGIKGIKVDFFGGDKQFYMQYYEDILRDANDFGLTVNFHGTTLPRGWERMYPNFVTDEAVKGLEFITFGQDAADLEAQHCATLPFVRNVVGPMDFTPMNLNLHLGPDRISGPVRRTTMAFELALPVVFFSGVQHLGLIPENLNQVPSAVVDYLRMVPTVWDETRFLSGYPGKDVIVARRTGKTWYIAGINGESVDKTLSFYAGGFLKSLIAAGSAASAGTAVSAGTTVSAKDLGAAGSGASTGTAASGAASAKGSGGASANGSGAQKGVVVGVMISGEPEVQNQVKVSTFSISAENPTVRIPVKANDGFVLIFSDKILLK
jgi:hypothetical protein